MFVSVWNRPLFTFLYSLPALLGYPAAKIFTVVVCLVTAHQLWRVAEKLGLDRAALTVPFLFLQPAYFQIAADTMTEPLFALVFVMALRLHLGGHLVKGAIVASAMILARPEGFFLGILWGLWILLDQRTPWSWQGRLAVTSLLASGAVGWWAAALLLTGDPLFILHNWPPDWDATGATYGQGSIWAYAKQLPEIAGPILCVFFLLGLIVALPRPRVRLAAAAFLTLLVLHTMFRMFGLFGSAGYARYFVCVAPATALMTLVGWNEAARWFSRLPRAATAAVASLVLILSASFAVFYVDAAVYTRDARAVAEMYDWYRANERPVTRLIWSQAYMCILLDRDPWEKPVLSTNKESNLEVFRQSPAGTLVFWDGDTGPAWYNITDDDLERAGYTRLRSKSYQFEGWIKMRWWYRDWGPRQQEMHLFYKAPESKA